MCKILIWDKFEKESDLEMPLEEVYELGVQINNEFKSGEHKKNKKVGGSTSVYRRHIRVEYRAIFTIKDNSIIFYYIKTKVNKEIFYRKATELETKDLNLEEIDFSWVNEIKTSLEKMIINRVEFNKKTSFMELFYNFYQNIIIIKYPKFEKIFHDFRHYPDYQSIIIEYLSKGDSEMNLKKFLSLSSSQIKKIIDRKASKMK